jgi:glycosyltransferase involved in cell wall biosynthesis
MAGPDSKMVLSVIVPAFNEEETIIQVLEEIARQDLDRTTLEVIVIDDGSLDGTIGLLESRPELYAKFIQQEKNGGKGAAVKAGLLQATGDYILFQDADLEYDPADYVKMLLPVRRFDADIVMGSRFSAPEFTRVSYFWNKVGNRCITLLFNLMNNTTFTDIYTCYLLYRRTLVDPAELKSTGWEQHAEILSKAISRSNAMYEVPITYHGRSYGEGKKIRAHHIIGVFWMIIKSRLFR